MIDLQVPYCTYIHTYEHIYEIHILRIIILLLTIYRAWLQTLTLTKNREFGLAEKSYSRLMKTEHEGKGNTVMIKAR